VKFFGHVADSLLHIGGHPGQDQEHFISFISTKELMAAFLL